MAEQLTLISHELCPYVQRAAIVLLEKAKPFERRWVDLEHKPGWFLSLSPLGKTPVLLAGGEAVFESAVICEYLDDTLAPRLHPEDALRRARHRAWMEFGSSVLNTIWAFYTAQDDAALAKKRDELVALFRRVEAALGESGEGPYFAGPDFSMVDAVFGPVFRYFDVFDRIAVFGFFDGLPKVQAWRQGLSERESVRRAVKSDYPERLLQFLRSRGSALSRRLDE